MSQQTLEFKAELKQLLHLITHSLYSDRDIFLRELISNAADAINKVRYDSLAHPERLEGDSDWKITLIPDKTAGTLTIRDNGIGMSREEAIDHLGTVAKSGTKAFLEAVKAKESASPGLIGQFGVGFYSAFMVADTVSVFTRPGGVEGGVEWKSDGQGQYSIEDKPKSARGTDVILHLKDDAKEYLDSWKLRELVRRFSDYIEHPVALITTTEKDGQTATNEEIINTRKAIWLRAKNEVTEEEYAEFYKQLSHDSEPPAKVLHFNVEGKTEFRALLFIPSHRSHFMDFEDRDGGLKLYVQRVLIMEKCKEVLPSYLRFVVGVVDSADLPLNVSRELLQNNPHLEIIRKNIVRNILSGLEGLRNTQPEKYDGFYKGLNPLLKGGLISDWENRDKVADLLQFESMNTDAGKTITFAQYVEKMPAEAKSIIYLSGESTAQLRLSPYLESFRAAGRDVLFSTEPVDEYVLPQYGEYKGKHLEDATRTAAAETVSAEEAEPYANLLAAMKVKLADSVKDVKLTKRLTDSAACLVADDGNMTSHMERVMRKFGEPVPDQKRILELNPNHAVVKALRDLHKDNPDDSRVTGFSLLLLDQAVIAEGSTVKDPVAFAKRINDLLLQSK